MNCVNLPRPNVLVIMPRHSALDLLLCVVLVSHCIHVHSTPRQLAMRNANDNVLMGRGDKPHVILNLESDELAREQLKANLQEIETVIHKKSEKPQSHHIDNPEYDINDVSTENFKVDIVVNDKVPSKEQWKRPYQDKEDFGSIFGHIGSSELLDKQKLATKPIKIQMPRESNQAVNEFEAMNSDGKMNIPTSTLVEDRDKNQKDSPADLNVDTEPEVIIL